jgi:hypothetical protein
MRKYFLIIVLIAFFGCKKDEQNRSCPYFLEAPPRYMFAPDSVKTDSTITISVNYDNPKSCQKFHSFLSNTVDTTTTIAIQTERDTCDCQDQLGPQFVNFNYKATSTPGHSIIRIHVTNNLYYSDTIVVY